jgi:hypothetical protein
MIEIPKEYWLYEISPDLSTSEIKSELDKVESDLKKLENQLKVLDKKGVNKKRKLIQEYNRLSDIRIILQKYTKYPRALQTYMESILKMNEADILWQEHNVCGSRCDGSYSPNEKCRMGHLGGCFYEPKGEKSLRTRIFEESEKYEEEADRLYNKTMGMLKEIGTKKIVLRKPE